MDASPRTTRRALLLAAAVVFLFKLGWIFAGGLDSSVVADDAYYYFTIARHLALGLGPTFDGLAPTNGFQPLWQVLLIPLWKLWPESIWTPIHASLALSALLDLLSAALLYGLGRRWIGERGGIVAAALWLFSAPGIVVGLRGMEASLSALSVLLFLRALLNSESSKRSALRVGLWLGAASLARLDNSLVLGLATSVFAVAARPNPLAATRWLGVAAAASVAVVTPWLLWSWAQFQLLLPVSALVKLQVPQLAFTLPRGGTLLSAAHLFFAPILVPLRFLCGEEFEAGPFFAPFAATILILLIAFIGMVLRSATDRPRWLLVPLTIVAGHALLYGLVIRSYSIWYAQPALAVSCLLLAWGIVQLRRSPRILTALGVAWLLTWTAVSARFASWIDTTPRGPELRWMSRIEELRASLPGGGGVLGAFDAGAVGYMASHVDGVTVRNLDGLVNNEAYRAQRENRLPEYIVTEVDILVQRLERAKVVLGPAAYERLLRLTRAAAEAQQGARDLH